MPQKVFLQQFLHIHALKFPVVCHSPLDRVMSQFRPACIFAACFHELLIKLSICLCLGFAKWPFHLTVHGILCVFNISPFEDSTPVFSTNFDIPYVIISRSKKKSTLCCSQWLCSLTHV